MDIEKMTAEAGGATGGETADGGNAPVATVTKKSDKPVVELFVMSHCPYGTQMEKGILPVAKALGNKIDFQVKFVDYAMHEKKEIDEQLRQYCINKEQAPVFIPYLECFLKAGDNAACLKETKVDEKKLATCVTNTDKQFKITESYNNKDSWGSQFPPFAIHQAENTKYGVQGSPTLVINGEQINSGRDAASLAKAICGAFNDGKAPKECSNTFASATPAPGFGTGTQAAGSGSAGAQCN
jgi:glutaredoxin